MATGTGIDAQIGAAKETTWGTFATPDHFYEFGSESIVPDVRKIYGRGIGRGRFQRKDRVTTYVAGAAGDVVFSEVLTNGFGFWLQQMFGEVATSQPDEENSPTVYLHTFVHDANALKGISHTLQVGRPSVDGTVNKYNYEGGKVTGWELTCNLDEAVGLTLNCDYETEQETDSLATPSYPSDAAMLTMVGGSVTVDGSTVDVSAVTLAGGNAVKTDRRFVGNKKKEQLGNGEFTITGTLEKEFESTAIGQAFKNGATATVVLLFEGPVIEDALKAYLKITLEEVEYTGGAVNVGGPDVIAQSVPFKALDDGTNPIIEVEYQTTDATP